MKAYKVELLIINHDNLSANDIISELEVISYPNDCISQRVIGMKGADIGDWSNDHPLNIFSKYKDAVQVITWDDIK
jgi:hypothetical protein